jgi:hypothetical protein
VSHVVCSCAAGPWVTHPQIKAGDIQMKVWHGNPLDMRTGDGGMPWCLPRQN